MNSRLIDKVFLSADPFNGNPGKRTLQLVYSTVQLFNTEHTYSQCNTTRINFCHNTIYLHTSSYSTYYLLAILGYQKQHLIPKIQYIALSHTQDRVENTLKKQVNYQITLLTYKIVSNSLKKRSNETTSLIIRFLEEEDMKFFQRLGQLDKLHGRNILTMTELTFQSSGHQVKCLSSFHLDESNQVLNYLCKHSPKSNFSKTDQLLCIQRRP